MNMEILLLNYLLALGRAYKRFLRFLFYNFYTLLIMVEIGTVAAQLLFWENFFRICGIVSLERSISLKHGLTKKFSNLLKQFAVA
jgi:hypothetical protein